MVRRQHYESMTCANGCCLLTVDEEIDVCVYSILYDI